MLYPVLEDFLSFLERKGYRSISDYKSMIKTFLSWLDREVIALSELNADHLSRYLVHCNERGLKTSTLHSTLTNIRAFCRYGSQQGLMPEIPTHEVVVSWLGVPGGYPAYQGPWRKLFRRPEFAVRYEQLPFAKELSTYAETLMTQTYTTTQIRNILCANFSFQHYLLRKGIQRIEEVEPKDVQAFLCAQLHRSKNVRQMMQTYIERFLVDAFSRQGRGFFPPSMAPKNQSPIAQLLQKHLEFCRVHRGLKESTIDCYRRVLKPMEAFLSRRGVRDMRKATITDIDAFVSKSFVTWSTKSKQGVNSVLRSFFRFLYLNGHVPNNLGDKLYRPSRFSQDLRPKYFPWEKIQGLLASIDRNSPKGKRDYAILLLFASYGFRAQEVWRLRILDVDFENKCLLVERKGGKTAAFPLRQEVAAAMKDYLAVRPSAADSELFLTCRRPAKPLGMGLNGIVAKRLLAYFGRLFPSQGPYLLRHSFAKAMRDRGAPLTDISAVFGHESLKSTSVYTRIDTRELRQVADNYANLLCP